MLPVGDVKIWLAKSPCDMRKAIHGLSVLVIDSLASEPQNGEVFVFYNRGKDRIKALYWHHNGFCLLQKRLEQGRFKIPEVIEGSKLSLSEHQLKCLFEGLHFVKSTQSESHYYY